MWVVVVLSIKECLVTTTEISSVKTIIGFLKTIMKAFKVVFNNYTSTTFFTHILTYKWFHGIHYFCSGLQNGFSLHCISTSFLLIIQHNYSVLKSCLICKGTLRKRKLVS